jgi:long-chain acyl-CoA synthetase
VNEAAAPTREARLAAATRGMTLSLHARVAPDRIAIVSPSGDRTFAELNANANRLVRALRARGIGAGDALVLVCANRPEFAEVLSACQRMGVRTTPANWHLTAGELEYIVSDSDASVVIGDARFASTVAAASERVRVRLAVGGAIDGFDSYSDAIAYQSSDDIPDPVVGRTMLYTSGTTGRPKGVDRPPAALEATPLTTALASATRYDAATDVHLCTGPLYHAAPLAFSLSAPLAYGVGVVLMDGWDADETLRLIARHRVTHTHMVPTMFHRLVALPDAVKQRDDLSSLRFVLHGAAPCPVPVKQALINWLGPVVYEYYAATEGGGTFVGPEEWLKKPGTVGRPVDDGLIRILDADGAELDPDVIGTVYLRAPARGRFRYYKDDAKTSSSYRGDYFTLGDHGYLDGDGYLFLTGRSAELIITGGVNVYPAEVDAVLLTHPAVADAGTIGIPDEEWGEVVRSVVELKPDVAASVDLAHELVVWCQEHLAHFKCPRAVDFVDRLPRHDNGKLYRGKLREMYVD